MLEVTAYGIIAPKMKLLNSKTNKYEVCNALYLPNLSYNLLSMLKTVEAEKMTALNKNSCQVLDEKK